MHNFDKDLIISFIPYNEMEKIIIKSARIQIHPNVIQIIPKVLLGLLYVWNIGSNKKFILIKQISLIISLYINEVIMYGLYFKTE